MIAFTPPPPPHRTRTWPPRDWPPCPLHGTKCFKLSAEAHAYVEATYAQLGDSKAARKDLGRFLDSLTKQQSVADRDRYYAHHYPNLDWNDLRNALNENPP